MKLQITRIAKNAYPHLSNSEYCLFNQDHFIYKYFYKSQKTELVCRLAPPKRGLLAWIKDRVARSWLIRKLTSNMGPGHIVELPDHTLLILYDQLYVYPAQSKSKVATPVHPLAKAGIWTPLRNGIAVHPESHMAYFGEYINGEPKDVRVFKIGDKGKTLECCYTFEKNRIKHIHSISWDRYRNRMWITTGDNDGQSGIYFTDDEFKSVHRLGGGDQSWRAVSLMIFQDCLIWGMDAGKDAPAEAINKIYSYQFGTQTKQEVQVIGNPAYHSIVTLDGGFLGVNFEPGRKQDTPESAALWKLTQQNGWQRVKEFPYQFDPKQQGSQYGYIYLPSGNGPKDRILFTATHCKERAGELLMATLQDNG